MVTTNEAQRVLTGLMQTALAGDGQAYQEFLRHISGYLRRFLARRAPACDVDDIVQDVLISIHKARHTYDGKRPVLPWVIAIARFRLTDYLRRHYAQARHMEVDIADVQDFLEADVTENGEASEYVSEVLEFLPEKQKTILRLMHMEGYTAKEVGARLRMKESAVKVAAHRAYKMIRTKWGTHG